MKLLPVLLLSLVTSAAAVVVYDQIRGRSEAPEGAAPTESDDWRELEARLAALEAREEPVLVGSGEEASSDERILELERRLAALETKAGIATAGRPRDEATTDGDLFDKKDGVALERFRELRDAARREDRRQRVAKRIDKALADLPLSLTPRQREKLLEAYEAFGPRRDAIWTEAKTRGAEAGVDVDWSAIITATSGRIEREFAERIETFLPYADATQVSAALHRVEGK